ncbi:MAG: glycosyl hydrolase-related protein, partial [Chloroflexi bacterium]|nr:glycosyl hydrolase-related protein [Chloroflexota bacterium]
GDLFLFNPLPWPRLLAGQVPQWVVSPRGIATDMTAGRHFQDRFTHVDVVLDTAVALGARSAEPSYLLPAVTVPGFGYTIVPRADLIDVQATTAVSEDAVVENEHYHLTFDVQRGGILSWTDKRLRHDWVDRDADFPFHSFVHERVSGATHPWPRQLLFEMPWISEYVERPRGWKTDWPAERRQAGEVLSHRVYRTPLGFKVIQSLQAPGCAGPLWQSVFVPAFDDFIECEAWWEMGLEVHPEATYLLFPFNVPQATARLDLGGQVIRPGADQLPGVCRDYFTVQQWVDFSNDQLGVTVALPDNPMVQFGHFHFGHNQADFVLERPLLLGWVTNNYWETNFRAHQPGRIHARYRLWPHVGGFNEAQAHRFGLEAANAQPLLQHLGEERADGRPLLPALGSLLRLPGCTGEALPVLTLHVKPARDQQGVIVRLLNTSDEEQQVEIGSGLWRIVAARQCDLLERPLSAVKVVNGVFRLLLPARRVATIYLELRPL